MITGWNSCVYGSRTLIGEDLDHRADLYSLGALIFMALTEAFF